ncbi:glyoxalase/bleomycin resistance protein/dioxygenase [Pseudomonas putida S11]|nr:glyoxalase/bleomycin resistance protein/dioxygenase [Pseudomonas putida S11]
MLTPFHVAYHVSDLDVARKFYKEVLGCVEGRSTETWVDFEFFGHQISLHVGKPFETSRTGKVGPHLVLIAPYRGDIASGSPGKPWLSALEFWACSSKSRRSFVSRVSLASRGRCFSWIPVVTRSRSRGSRI